MGLLNFRRKSKKQSSDYPSTFIQSEVEIPSLPVYNEKHLSLSSPTLSKSQTFSKVPDTSLMDDIMNELGSSKDASSKPMPSSTTNPKVIRPLLQFDTPLEETVKSATNNPAASFELESATGQQKPLLHFSSIKKPTFQHQENKKLELQQENHTNNLNNRDEHTD
ncbi:hypothetical protein CU098_013527 [Rhizopus stolonifer]|uniref:Uncharacterized protein n=1 Tax=Rhizopus stolonifer TaxID=4846 RepID=A0A367KVG9_RHIST|nr:hypothetical protein CU098_013527 [Rhizopus stolonifer]